MLWVWGELALAQHKPETALRLADALFASAPSDAEAQVAQGQPIPALSKMKGEALFALGQVEKAIQSLEEARRGAREQSALPLLWQIHRSLGHVYTATQRKPLARREFAAARGIISDLATSIAEIEQRERFVSAALASLPKEQPLTPRQLAKQAFGGLSEQERMIAMLVAKGRTNREIAEALVISQRTVGTHLGHIYAKLGIDTRVQLAAWTIEKGLTWGHSDPT
jgi:DNA-binding CsgD family transcriptional regulator